MLTTWVRLLHLKNTEHRIVKLLRPQSLTAATQITQQVWKKTEMQPSPSNDRGFQIKVSLIVRPARNLAISMVTIKDLFQQQIDSNRNPKLCR